MVIKEIKMFLDGNKLAAQLILQTATGTTVTRKVPLAELGKINVKDDISVANGKVKILKKVNKNKFVYVLNCPDCGRPLTVEKVCANIYGCPNQRAKLLKDWCNHYKLVHAPKYIKEILNYYSFNNGQIIDREKKLATEFVIPVLYLLSQGDWYAITKDAKLAKTVYKEVQATKQLIETQAILEILPNNLSIKEKATIAKKYPIQKFWSLYEKDRVSLSKYLSQEKITALFQFIADNRVLFEIMQGMGISAM